jgi:hypothetical protein
MMTMLIKLDGNSVDDAGYTTARRHEKSVRQWLDQNCTEGFRAGRFDGGPDAFMDVRFDAVEDAVLFRLKFNGWRCPFEKEFR